MNTKIIISIFISLILVTGMSEPSRAKIYLAHDPAWAGYWIWGSAENAPSVEVDLSRWLRAHPGGWGRPLVRRILGNAACTGLRNIYWDMQDDEGKFLYPSKQTKQIRRWTNWCVDFGNTDMPALAVATAKALQLNLSLVASKSSHEEIQKRYPGVKVVSPESVPAGAIPGMNITRENLGVLGRYQNPSAQYFRKTFEVTSPVQMAELCLTAMQPYRVYLDGKLIGSDAAWQEGETYTVTKRLFVGKHVLAVKVQGLKKPSWMVGLIVNLRWTDTNGQQHLLVTDPAWRRTEEPENGWYRPGFDDGGWNTSVVVGIEGTGERFLRLEPPWRNPRPLLSSQTCDDMLITGVRIRCGKNPNKVSVLQDRRIHDTHGKRWSCKGLPVTFEFQLPKKELVGGMRIYSGWLRYAYAPSGPGEVKQFQLQARVDGKWTNVCGVQNVPPYRREYPLSRYHYEVFFKPVLCDRLRLRVLESHDAGKRFSNLGAEPLPPLQRWCNLREIELLRTDQ